MSRVSSGASSSSCLRRAMAQLALLLEVGERRDADQVALADHAEALGLEHDVERLIPGDVAHADGDVAA